MDIQHLIDRLEDLFDEGRHLPMSRFTMIDEERALEIIDQMRISIPEQIEKATRVVNQRDRLIAQANEGASRMIDLARKKNDDLINRDSIVQAAQHRAENLMAQARVEAETIRDEADSYVTEVLKELESHLLRTLTIVRNGISKIVQDREIRAQNIAQMRHQLQQPLQQPVPATPVAAPQDDSHLPAPANPANVSVESREMVDADGS
jgi:hypothetical protein